MNDKKLDQIANDLSAIKRLLVLLLQHQEVKGKNIAKALGVSKGRVSQMAATKEYKRRKEVPNG
jgi:DNA-directed RNA polymerase specialized sigma subunit